VLVPAFTFAATANAVIEVGAVPVFVDIGDDYLIDLADAQRKVSPKTAAIMPVHLYGLMADMEAVSAFAGHHDLVIVEDAAQAHLATRGGISPGERGVATYSLYATKNMMSGEGGLVATTDPRLADRLRLFRNHGMPERYRHEVWGLNLRLSDLHASIGRAQLAKLPEANARRIENAHFLTDELPPFFVTPDVPNGATHVFHQYTVRVPAAHRDEIVERFRGAGVGVDIYYPIPLNRQEAFARWKSACPASEGAANEVLSLPIHPKVDEPARERIIATAEAIAREFS
jgi:dTDP-4-amino-4,6-dideoxygalactose transaminase